MTDQQTDVVAAAGVLSPFLLTWIDILSHGAAVALPILGVVWLVVRILHKLCHWNTKDEG